MIFCMIPPTKTEGEVDQRKLTEGDGALKSAVELHWRPPEAGWQRLEF